MDRLAVVFLFCIFSSSAFAGTNTTDNLLPEISNFSTSGGTVTGPARGCPSGAFCTSGTQGGGGTYQTSFDVPLTKAEVNEGFELNYGLETVSHSSNAVLATCNNIMQSGDCRDVFNLTVSLFDAGSVVEKFEHDVELDFAGARNFTFQSGVTANSYGVLTGQYEFFAIDAGFPSGFFGPQISNPHLSITHTLVSVIEQDRLVLDNPILKGK